jgi:hypothetical protein
LNGELVAVHEQENGIDVRQLSQDTEFIKHKQGALELRLRRFDPARQALFALDREDVLLFDRDNYGGFYTRLLRSSAGSSIEPFYRLSVAVEAGDQELIRDAYFACAKKIQRLDSESRDFLARAVNSISPQVESAVAEWQSRQELKAAAAMRPIEKAATIDATVTRDAVVESLTFPSIEPGRITQSIEESLRAGSGLDLLDLGYASAIRVSLGGRDLEPPDTVVHFSEIAEEVRVPDPNEVSRISGLSLPHLEFQGIILNRTSAKTFLSKCSSEGPEDTVQILGKKYAEARLNRKTIRSKRRPVFTFAEILVLAEYRGTLEFPVVR